MLLPLPLSDRNLILTGYTGPNQPRIGQQIATSLKMPYIDFELQIAERASMSVEEIRNVYGEARLKNIETDLIEEACLRRHTVLRISARTLLNADTLTRISDTGPVICLVTTLDAMLQRLHMAMGARYYNPEERAFELGKLQREWAVRGLPNVRELNTTTLDTDGTIEQVITLWQSLAVARG